MLLFILVAGRANEDVDMNSADQISRNRGTRRQDGNEADEETDPEGQVKKDEMNLKLFAKCLWTDSLGLERR